MKTETTDDGIVFRREDGAAFSVSFDDGELFVHASAPDGQSASLLYEENCVNEGWLKMKLRPGVGSQPLRKTP